MTNRPTDLDRLARHVKQRREELGLRQDQLKDRGGPSTTTLSKIENATDTPAPVTLRKLDDSLDWERGSAARTLRGGDPTPTRRSGILPPRVQPTRRRHSASPHDASSTAAVDVVADATFNAPPMDYFSALRSLQSVIESVGDALQITSFQENFTKAETDRAVVRLDAIRTNAIELLVEYMRRDIERMRSIAERFRPSTDQVMEALGLAPAGSADPESTNEPWWLDDRDALAEAFLALSEDWASTDVEPLFLQVADSLPAPLRRPARQSDYDRLKERVAEILEDRHDVVDDQDQSLEAARRGPNRTKGEQVREHLDRDVEVGDPDGPEGGA